MTEPELLLNIKPGCAEFEMECKCPCHRKDGSYASDYSRERESQCVHCNGTGTRTVQLVGMVPMHVDADGYNYNDPNSKLMDSIYPTYTILVGEESWDHWASPDEEALVDKIVEAHTSGELKRKAPELYKSDANPNGLEVVDA